MRFENDVRRVGSSKDVVAVRERIDHRLLKSAARILLRVGRLPVGLVEERDRLGIEQLLKPPRLIEQRTGDLEAPSNRIGSVLARVAGVDRERSRHKPLRLTAEQQHGVVPRPQQLRSTARRCKSTGRTDLVARPPRGRAQRHDPRENTPMR